MIAPGMASRRAAAAADRGLVDWMMLQCGVAIVLNWLDHHGDTMISTMISQYLQSVTMAQPREGETTAREMSVLSPKGMAIGEMGNLVCQAKETAMCQCEGPE